MRNAFLALFVVGGYYVYRNRFQIQRFLESKGVSLPLDTSNLGNSLKSGLAKISGKSEKLDEDIRRAV